MLDSLRDGLQNAVKKLLGASTVDEQAVKEFVRDLQRTLIQADVNVRLVIDLTERVQKRALEERPLGGITRKDQIVAILYDGLCGVHGKAGPPPLDKNKLNVIVMVGIQGAGKTTTSGKLARFLTKQGFKVGLVAADTFRPGAVTQLKTLGVTVGVEVYSDEKERDSIKIAKEGKKYFQQSKNVIIIDTAGRHKEEKGLLDEMKKIISEVKPDMNILVIDGTIGQQCYNQALAFHQTAPVGGIIVAKLDGAAKGGGALAAAAATGARILYLGTGERVDDLEEFSPTRFVGRLLGMGDIKGLLEAAQQAEIEVDQKSVQRMMSGKLTMDDLLLQFDQMKKFGSLRKIVERLPGVSGNLQGEDLEKAESRVKVYKPIIQSMTREEKVNQERVSSVRMRRRETIKAWLSKSLSERIARATRRRVDKLNPELAILVDLGASEVRLNARPVFIYGRYTKPAGIGQRKTFCTSCRGSGCAVCGYSGDDETKASVESTIKKRLGTLLGSKKMIFTWIGTEDPGSAVGPSGRPFVVEAKNPRKRRAPRGFVTRTGIGQTSVSGWKLLPRRPSTLPSFKFTTRVAIDSTSRVSPEDLRRLSRLMRNVVVEFRRPGEKPAYKRVYSVKARAVRRGGILADIKLDGGLPVKRLVNGDSVSPSISEVLKADLRCRKFDILRVEVGKFQYG